MPDAPQVATVLIAILVRNKAYTLPLFLKCLELQTWPKPQTGIYIRENDSSDESNAMLREWAAKQREAPAAERYLEIYEDYSSVPGAAEESTAEWTVGRFAKLAKIRRASIDYADVHGYDAYCVVDADNFIRREVLSNLMAVRSIGVVAPYLRHPGFVYSNYHYHVDSHGYFLGGYGHPSQHYYDIVHNQTVRGFIECQVVHCTYLISREFYDASSYEDGSDSHEYVILSRNLRAAKVAQYLDNREVWGALTMQRVGEAIPREDRIVLLDHVGLCVNGELSEEARDLAEWLNWTKPEEVRTE